MPRPRATPANPPTSHWPQSAGHRGLADPLARRSTSSLHGCHRPLRNQARRSSRRSSTPMPPGRSYGDRQVARRVTVRAARSLPSPRCPMSAAAPAPPAPTGQYPGYPPARDRSGWLRTPARSQILPPPSHRGISAAVASPRQTAAAAPACRPRCAVSLKLDCAASSTKCWCTQS